jgi:hypothetical protein
MISGIIYHMEWQTLKHGPRVMLVEADIDKQSLRRAVAHASFGGPQCDGFRPMKRPPSGDARSAPARCVKRGWCVGKEECYASSTFGSTARGLPRFHFMF